MIFVVIIEMLAAITMYHFLVYRVLGASKIMI